MYEFDFEIEYGESKSNCQADAMSRMHTEVEKKMDLDEEIPSHPIQSQDGRSTDEAELRTHNTSCLLANSDDAELNELESYVTVEELIQYKGNDPLSINVRSR